MMDLSIVIKDWPYDESDDANNVRKVVGLDGSLKVQVRIRGGVIQWECDGRPDGARSHGFATALDYCRQTVTPEPAPGTAPSAEPAELDGEMAEELAEELFDYYRRGRAMFQVGDYGRALRDSLHNLEILDFMREHHEDSAAVFKYDRYRPGLLLDRGRCAMLLHLQAGNVRLALDAVNAGIRDIEAFFCEYRMDDELLESTERQILVDLRRSLREKHNVPLNDDELMHSLQVEQEIAIRRENYEMAARLRDKIKALKHRTPSQD